MKRTIIILAAAGIVAAVSGASAAYNPEKYIVKIDGQNAITAGDLVSYFERVKETADEGFKPSAENIDDLRSFLKDIINARVVALEGRKRELDQAPEFRKDVETYVSNYLRERTRRKIREAIVIPEEEIREHYEMNAEWRKVSYIICQTQEQADAAYAELVAGKPWEDVCRAYSTADNKDQGGKDDRTLYYSGDELSSTVYETPVGSFTPVIPYPYINAFLIFRIDEKIPGHGETYEEARPNIVDNLTQRRVDEATRVFLEERRAQANITVDQVMYDTVISGHLTEAREKFNRQLTPQIISTVDGVPVYFETWFEGLMMEGWAGELQMEEESLKDNTRLKEIMDRRLKIFQDEALLEAAARADGVMEDPAVIKDIRDYEDKKLVDEMYEKEFVPTVPAITEADIQSYYDRHLVDFQIPEHAEVFIVGAVDEAKTRALLKRVQKGEDIVAVGEAWVKEYFENEAKTNPTSIPPENILPIGDKADIDRIAPDPMKRVDSSYAGELREKVFAAQPGDIVGPFQLQDGRWAFFKYLALVPMYQRPLSEEFVHNDCKAYAKQERMTGSETDVMCTAWFDGMRALHKIQIDEKVLRQAWEKVKGL